MPASEAERTLARSLGGYRRAARAPSRAAITEDARRAFWQRFLDEADGDPVRAESLRKAWYTDLSLKSARARRLAREAKEKVEQLQAEAAQAEAELADGGAA